MPADALTARRLLAMLAACALLVVLFARDWTLPGLYIDAVNPEYLIPGILEPPGSLVFSVPGNRLADRFPVFTATLYHGSAQLYAALPFMALFGASLPTLRLVQLLVGLAILVLTLALARRGRVGTPALVALCAAGALAVEPSFVLGLRTQAYSILFSVLLLLGALRLLLGWRTARRPRLCLIASGALYGLATFGYFVIAFFVPAIAWLLLRPDAADGLGRAARWRAAALWAAGLAIGELPFALGMLLLTIELGGPGALADFLRDTTAALKPGQDTSGPLARIGTVLGFFWSVASGEWPRLQILQDRGTGALDDLRTAVLVALPALCLARRIGSRAERRALAVPVALIASYLIVALIFAGRLGGHHFTALLPFLYVAFGMACAIVWPADARAALRAATDSRTRIARRAGVSMAIIAVLASGLLAQQQLHRDLVRTGGVDLFSDAIDRFAAAVDRETPNATIHAPDFGDTLSLASSAGRRASTPPCRSARYRPLAAPTLRSSWCCTERATSTSSPYCRG